MEKVKINIVPKGLKPACYVSQNDNGRVVRFELFDELTPYTLDGSETITITVVRPDGVELVSSVVNTEDSYIDVVFNDDMTAIAGIADCELTITDGETVIGSRNFDMNIEIDAYNGKDVVIETATGVIASFNTEVEDNALEYESEIPYNAEGYTGLEIINSRTAPVYDKTPYLFRKTPDGSGNSCIEKLTGLSVAFNQLLPDAYKDFNNTTTDSRSLYLVIRKSTSPYTPLYADSILQVGVLNVILSASFTDYIQILHSGTQRNIDIIPANVLSVITGHKYFISLKIEGVDTTTVGGLIVKNIECIDLTAFFGSSTIADYLYNLEQATAGAGVQKFKELGFDKPYYAYNAGSLLSSKPVSKKVVGFNQWSEEWEVAGTGTASKNYIPVKNGGTYYFKIPIGWLTVTEYDADKNAIITYSVVNNTRTLSANCFYIKFVTSSAYGTTYNHDICINISDPAKNGTYEPYSEETYNLGGDELRGILKLDADNNIYADGDIKTSDGKIKRKFDIVDLGSLNWNRAQLNNQWVFFAGLSGGSQKQYFKGICQKYPIVENIMFTNDKTASLYGSTSPYQFSRIAIRDDNYTVESDFKTAMDGVYLVYELAAPTSESADPFTDPQEVKVTEELIDGRAVEIPVGHDTVYGTDIEYLDIDFDTTIFGGDINAIDGVLTSRYNSDGSVKTTPDVIELDPALIPVKAGDNNIFNSASGAQTIRYYNQED